LLRQFSPLVEPYQRKDWEKFAWENKGSTSIHSGCHLVRLLGWSWSLTIAFLKCWPLPGWINESMKMQATDPNYYGKINFDHKLVYPIHHDLFDVPYDENRTMAPSW
jgi:hypothetical protein